MDLSFKSICANYKDWYMIQSISDYVNSGFAREEEIKYLVAFADRYVSICISAFMFDNLNVYDLAKLSRKDVYKVNASDGLRIATQDEVKNYSENLVYAPIYPIGEEKRQLLNLLAWSYDGKLNYYTMSGFKYTYKETLVDTIYEMIIRADKEFNALFDWMETANFKKDMTTLRKNRKKYVYPEYAADEYVPTVPMVQVISNLKSTINSTFKNEELTQVYRIFKKMEGIRYTQADTMDLVYLRNVYNKIQGGLLDLKKEETEAEYYCKLLDKCKEDGLLNGTEFAFKISTTIKGYGYKRCSEKQLGIIKSAINMAAKKKKEDEEKPTERFEHSLPLSLTDMSNELGSGLNFI